VVRFLLRGLRDDLGVSWIASLDSMRTASSLGLIADSAASTAQT